MSFLYSGSLWSSLYCGVSSLCVGLYRWLVKVSWLGKLVSVFWCVELDFFSPWNSPGKNTGLSCHFLLQGIFPTQGSNPGLLHCRQIIYHLNNKGSPCSFLVFVKSINRKVAQTVKNSTCNMGDLDSIPGLGRSLGGGYGNPLQYSCLENPHGQRSWED